jgi:hypothetical protein
MDTWAFTRDDFLSSAEVDTDVARQLRTQSDMLIEAFLRAVGEFQTEGPAGAPTLGLSAAPLLIPGTRYHVSLSKAAKASWKAAVRILATALLLHQQRLFDLAANVSVQTFFSLYEQLSHLTPEQHLVVESILALKRSSQSPLYWPAVDEVSTHSGLSLSECSNLLISMNGKVVEYVPHAEGWRVLL